MKEAIEKILEQHLGVEEPEGSMDGAPWDFFVGGIPEAAAAIAELYQEQLDILCRERNEFEAQTLDQEAEYQQLEARLAEMRRVIEMVEFNHDARCVWCGEWEPEHRHDCPRQKALAAGEGGAAAAVVRGRHNPY